MSEPAHKLKVSREYGETMPIESLGMADAVRTDTYDRAITEEERASYGEKVVELSMEVDNKEDEKKATVKMFSDDIKAAKTERKDVLKIMKKGTIETADKIHTFYDFETAKVHEYNSIGERVAVRRMKPEERQLNINA